MDMQILKKLTALLLSFCMMFVYGMIGNSLNAVISARAVAYPSTYMGMGFTVLGDEVQEVQITDGFSTSGYVYIPDEIYGLPVTSIGEYAFMFNTDLEGIRFGSNVRRIESTAFCGCENLEYVVFPENITRIESSAFEKCYSLSEVMILNPDCIIEDYAFTNNFDYTFSGTIFGYTGSTAESYAKKEGCDFFSLGYTYGNWRYTIQENSIEIIEYASSSSSIEIPSQINGLPVTDIGDSAFIGCENLISVTIPDSVTGIGGYAFAFCTNLTSVIIPESVTHIGDYAFSDTPWLEKKQKESPLVVVNHILIDGSTCKGDVIIPDSVITITESAFCDYPGITSVIIPDSVTSIGWLAFAGCSNLTSVTIENPNCEIYDDSTTISNECDDDYNFYFYGIIYGYPNSTAQAYAEKYGYMFIALDEPELLQGDINDDGEINAMDAALILVEAAALGAGLETTFTTRQTVVADVNKDDRIDATDAAYVLRYAAAKGSGIFVGTLSEFMTDVL